MCSEKIVYECFHEDSSAGFIDLFWPGDETERVIK